MNFTTIHRFIFALALFVFAASASPVLVESESRDVYVPPVTYPKAGTIWKTGQRHNITWDVSSPPKQITNKKGFILLRKGDLSTPLVLANGFDILRGRIEVTVPFVLGGSDYSLVLFGDSGNFSPKFTIQSPLTF